MPKNIYLNVTAYVILSSCSTLTSAIASNYLCPEPNLVVAETAQAIKQGKNEVTIHTNYGTLTASIGNKEIVQAQIESNFTPEFHHAAILFQSLKIAPYDLECAYDTPELIFYMHDTRLFIGATDYYWFARGQGQQGPYAWCNGKGNGVENCSFIDEPST